MSGSDTPEELVKAKDPVKRQETETHEAHEAASEALVVASMENLPKSGKKKNASPDAENGAITFDAPTKGFFLASSGEKQLEQAGTIMASSIKHQDKYMRANGSASPETELVIAPMPRPYSSDNSKKIVDTPMPADTGMMQTAERSGKLPEAVKMEAKVVQESTTEASMRKSWTESGSLPTAHELRAAMDISNAPNRSLDKSNEYQIKETMQRNDYVQAEMRTGKAEATSTNEIGSKLHGESSFWGGSTKEIISDKIALAEAGKNLSGEASRIMAGETRINAPSAENRVSQIGEAIRGDGGGIIKTDGSVISKETITRADGSIGNLLNRPEAGPNNQLRPEPGSLAATTRELNQQTGPNSIEGKPSIDLARPAMPSTTAAGTDFPRPPQGSVQDGQTLTAAPATTRVDNPISQTGRVEPQVAPVQVAANQVVAREQPRVDAAVAPAQVRIAEVNNPPARSGDTQQTGSRTEAVVARSSNTETGVFALTPKQEQHLLTPPADQATKTPAQARTEGITALSAAKEGLTPAVAIQSKETALPGAPKETALPAVLQAKDAAAQAGLQPKDGGPVVKTVLPVTTDIAGVKISSSAAAAGVTEAAIKGAQLDAGKSATIDAKVAAVTPTIGALPNGPLRPDANSIHSQDTVTGAIRNAQQGIVPPGGRADISGGRPGGINGNTFTGVVTGGRNGDASAGKIISAIRGMRAEDGGRRYLTGAEIGLLIAAAGIAKARIDAHRASKDGGQKDQVDGKIVGRIGKDFVLTGTNRASRQFSIANDIAGAARRFPGREITLSAVLAITGAGAGKMRDLDHTAGLGIGKHSPEHTAKIVRTMLQQEPPGKIEFDIPTLFQTLNPGDPANGSSDSSKLDNQLFAFLPAAPALLRARRKNDADDEDDKKEIEELDSEDTNSSVNAIQGYRAVHRISVDETLVSIAESKLEDARLAWLIADINADKIREHMVDGKRVVEVCSGQQIDLPLPSEIEAFNRREEQPCDPDNLVTIIVDNESSRAMVEEHLNTLFGFLDK